MNFITSKLTQIVFKLQLDTMASNKLICLLAILVTATHSVPLSAEDKSLDKGLVQENQENIQILQKIFDKLEGTVEENIGKLFSKINSLSLVSNQLLELTKNIGPATVALGRRNDMTLRCPKGFRARVGGSTCY